LGVDARGHLTGRTLTTVAAWRLRDEDLATATARAEATRLAKRVLALELELAKNKTTCEVIVAQMAPRVLDLPGVGPITAAVALLAFSHPGRIRSEAAVAALAGACPIPASSGNTVRHRLNRGGDRRLNRALHTIALVRTIYEHAPEALGSGFPRPSRRT
jgi:transposase